MVNKLKSPRRLIALAAFAIVAMSAFGFAAANTMPPDTKAGDGESSISGYEVTDIHYNFDGATPANVTSVDFTLDADASSVRASINGTSSTACSASGTTWTCNMPAGITVEEAATLYVVAAE